MIVPIELNTSTANLIDKNQSTKNTTKMNMTTKTESQMTREQKVQQFRQAANKGTINDEADSSVYRCLQEEYDEACEAIIEYLNSPDESTRKNLAKELADLQYVLSQVAVYLNLDLEEAFERVHVSNMSKLVEGKALLREDGKILKGPKYQTPDMSGI